MQEYEGQTPETGSGRENAFFLFVILAVTLIAYAPLISGVWELSSRTTQATNAFLLLGVVFVDSLLFVLKVRRFHPAINAHGLLLFGLSCMALAVASFTSVWPFAVMGLCLNAGALLSFCFGRKGVAVFYPALAGFGVMVAMLVMVPGIDNQLRILAGTVSSWILPIFGIRADLVLQHDPFQVIVVAEKGAGAFNVATECNGIGILMSSVVLALILALRRRFPWYGVILLTSLSVVIGIAFNTIRIVAIVMTTLQTSVRFGLIHEGLGTLIYLLALAVVYVMNSLVARRRT